MDVEIKCDFVIIQERKQEEIPLKLKNQGISKVLSNLKLKTKRGFEMKNLQYYCTGFARKIFPTTFKLQIWSREQPLKTTDNRTKFEKNTGTYNLKSLK